ncbi:MAG: hypothetical protein BECKG1743D_GA0114223_106342 [Candidatus Kentron sp. G]|nr:MAG: hypothetical protein BECKG1743F_GA0114225_107122 [Candidatus Kentron sp. G]VFN03809.1 MAG: hypothetical protein BECKG1743E_GA0114224_106582 [Candidatus Kentron sp. G]VFN04800.1 MAG: hypothetical protein BECKG1743D_GA0114223_106342 [Candidatus Kentron sp. G]
MTLCVSADSVMARSIYHGECNFQYHLSCMQKSSCTPNIVKNSLKMLIYFRVNSAFSLPSFMTYRASLWDTI